MKKQNKTAKLFHLQKLKDQIIYFPFLDQRYIINYIIYKDIN